MYVFEDSTSDLEAWIREEVEPDGVLVRESRGAGVKRVQEWLNLHGHGLVIDSDYGPATADAVGMFQADAGLEPTGEVDDETFLHLVRPMRSALQQRLSASQSIESAVLEYARAHLAEHPLEIGGQNRGPWVRLYMKGNEGSQWAWCAGFVTFILRQAVDSLNTQIPIPGSFSCDSLAAQGRNADLFLPEADANPGSVAAGSIFLVRRTETDWTHTGLVTEARADVIRTIEGNTNDEGSREGFEVCARSRGYKDKDFILLSH